MDIEDLFQQKNDNVSGITAPLLDSYPEGYVDTPKLPLVLTWVLNTNLDATSTIETHDVQIDVFVQVIGQSRFKEIKKECKRIRDLYLTEYAITPTNMWISNDPPLKVIPSTIQFGGFRDLIFAPDETPFHGFIITLTAEGYPSADCT